jgi:peptidoglycan/xylan/chitin deacetylase (PgdA/CDA1 family)
MNWEEIERLSDAGIDIESHCATHAILTGLGAEEMTAELRDSLSELRGRGFGRHGLLAYPSGLYDEDILRTARSLGYRSAVTIEEGVASATSDPFELPRLCVHQGISGSREEFLLKIPGRA